MKNHGWVKLHRSLLNWEWYDDDVAYRVFTHLLMTCNYEDKKWKGLTIKAGQRVMSYPILAEEIGKTVQNVRTAILKLESTGEVARSSTGKFSIITLLHWEE